MYVFAKCKMLMLRHVTLRYVTLREGGKQALALNNAAFHSTRELVITRNHEFTSSEIVFH